MTAIIAREVLSFMLEGARDTGRLTKWLGLRCRFLYMSLHRHLSMTQLGDTFVTTVNYPWIESPKVARRQAKPDDHFR
jgi:hypothetical protein